MKKRIVYIIGLYTTLVALFALQKTAFMIVDKPEGNDYGIVDWWNVVVNGLYLDIPMAGYLIALPLLLIVASVWLKRSVSLRRVVFPYYVVVAVVTGVIFIADMALYPYWQFKLDALALSYLESPQGAFASVSAGFVAVRLLLVVVTVAAEVWLMSVVTPRVIMAVASLRQRIIATVLAIVIMPLLVISIRGGVGESTANIGKVYFSDDTFLNHSAVNPTFSLIYSLDKTSDYASEFDYFSEEERTHIVDSLGKIQSYSTSLEEKVDNVLNTSRPNILVILMEGFGGQFVEAISGRKDIAPNYNRLAKEGIFFTRCYSNSFRTDRGTVSTLSGYPSFPTLSVMKIPAKSRTLPCLASTLNSHGYESSFLYGGDINFTNMQSYLRTGGYQTIVSDIDFPADEKRQNPWGANDDVTFNRLYSMITRQRHQPWHICYLTLSSHEPWTVPYERLKEEIPNAFAFTDHCLGQFIEHLRNTPL